MLTLVAKGLSYAIVLGILVVLVLFIIWAIKELWYEIFG